MKKIVLGALALALAPASANAAAFMNGGFEAGTTPPAAGTFTTLSTGSTAITGWTVAGLNIDWIDNAFWQAAEGSRSLDLNGTGPGGITQTFDTIAGVTYNVRFSLAGNPDSPNGKVLSTVATGGRAQEYEFSLAGTRQNMNWQQYTYSFTAGAPTTTLSFYSANSSAFGPALDAVSVTAVPEPATWAMMLIGFGVIGGAMRRRSGSRRIALA